MATRLMSKSVGHAGWSGGGESGIGAAAEPLRHRPRQREECKVAGRRLEDGCSISGRPMQRAGVDHARTADAFIPYLMRVTVQQIVDSSGNSLAQGALDMAMRIRDGSVIEREPARGVIVYHAHVSGVSPD